MGQIKIKTFGILAEKLQASEFDFPASVDTEELLARLVREYPILQDLHFSMAVNKQMIHGKMVLKGDEEIALLPPFSGG